MKKTFKGKVIITKMPKTAIVVVAHVKVHPLYKKRLLRHKRYKVDTTGFTLEKDNIVEIAQTRPISKEKNFKVVRILT